MSPLTKTRLRRSEVRSRIREIAELPAEEITPEIRSELDELKVESSQLETLYQSQILAQDDPEEGTVPALDAESRERENLRQRCSLVNYFRGYRSGASVSGPELEYRQAFELPDRHIPLELFEEPAEPAEQRAITAAPTTTGRVMRPIVPAVFSESVAPMLGIEMPTVDSGSYHETRLTTNLSSDWEGVGDDATITAAAFTQSSTTPHRISAGIELAAETLASVGISNFEGALRQNLQMVLSNALDVALLRGSGTGDEPSGLITALGSLTAESTTSTWTTVLGKVAGLIDGLWCRNLKDANLLLGTATHQKFVTLFPASTLVTNPQTSLDDYLMSKLMMLKSSAQMPAAASNVQTALACLKGRPGQRTAACPHWGSLEIQDQYTLAPKAQRRYLAHVLVGDVLVVNPAAYKLLSFKLA